MTKLEKLYSIIENSRDVGVKLSNSNHYHLGLMIEEGMPEYKKE